MCTVGLGVDGPLMPYRLPDLAHRVLADIGKTTLPLSLFTIGVSLYGKEIRRNLPRIALVSGFKLLLLPFFMLLLAGLTGFNGLPARVVFLQAAMPVAVPAQPPAAS